MSFCHSCSHWRYEENVVLRNEHEQEGFGVCELFEQMRSNPLRALVRTDDEFAGIQMRGEFGCNLFQQK
ncbi:MULTISPECIES: hypothetical protein [Sedimenticola]|uniref:Uncharacterized protein n=1 Tax=Sedimenticola selenatireducens TaxID=191960 RepID=A0A2N6CXA2_9GAMM|nr:MULTISPECIES: hypothetical protein [Sedimenticola]MCW8902740.1 hypothetical protein [Sedimenticola sp.]PLX61919.1 MAG: hypothetical protein C0630_07840 [Sedimenticola selenatireducens]